MEHFFGDHFQLQELEVIGMHVDPAHRTDTPQLLSTRWFDYRGMHPVTATYLYAALYKEQVRIFAETYVDIGTADEAKAFTPDDIFRSRDMTCMWLARCSADRAGVPYTTALSFAQTRAHDRTFQRFPRPNQLYGEEFELDLADYWKTLCAGSLQYSRSPRFDLSTQEAASAHPDVVAHARQVVEQVQSRPAPHTGLLARMFREGRLNPAWRLPFPAAEVVAAERLAFPVGR